MISPTTLTQYLIDRNFLGREEAIDARLSVQNSSRRNLVFKVTRSAGHSYLVKQGINADTNETIRREASAYRNLKFDKNLDRILPKIYGYDPRSNILILELVADAMDLRSFHESQKRTPTFIGEILGSALADIHSHRVPPRNFAKPSHFVPAVFRFHTPRLRTLGYFSPGQFEVIKIMQQFGFRKHLEALRRGWRLLSFTHGDLRWDNCLIRKRSALQQESRVNIVDWELAGAGDPGWDAAAVIADYLNFWVSLIPITGDSAPDRHLNLAEIPLERMQPALRSFWRVYAERITHLLGLTKKESQEFLFRSIRYTAACLIQRSFEDSTDGLSGKMISVMQLSLNIFERTRETCADLLGIPC
jgi:aminoglycoside phosphotransferase (APT) family kinase protein